MTFIIAEAGVNHNGSIELAKQLIDVAVEAKCDCVKFQTFISEEGVCKSASKAAYQIENTGNEESQLEMVKKLELPFEAFVELKNYCQQKGVMFLSTPFDLPSVDFLNNLGMSLWKIPSGEIVNLPLMEKINSFHQDVILSTGMATLSEIREALKVLKDSNVKLLHCTTEYPCPFTSVNMKAMLSLRDEFNVEFGYSDHTKGIEIPIMAVAMGATIIEKHFTLDKNMDGPDHKASLNPTELKDMVRAIRNVEQAFGTGIKTPQEAERKNISIVRKSIVAKRPIKHGELLTVDNLTMKRPGTGISPMKWYEVIGTLAQKNYEEDEQI